VRLDGSRASNTDFAAFNRTRHVREPRAYAPTMVRARLDSGGVLEREPLALVDAAPASVLTVARASVALDGNNNSLTNAIINLGHIGNRSCTSWP
jgi:hypothetical protein